MKPDTMNEIERAMILERLDALESERTIFFALIASAFGFAIVGIALSMVK